MNDNLDNDDFILTYKENQLHKKAQKLSETITLILTYFNSKDCFVPEANLKRVEDILEMVNKYV